jgi:hypothetical protein
MTSTVEIDTTKSASLAAWKKNRNHSITLPSSTVVEIVIPDLPGLVKTGAIPNELVDIAIGVAQGKKVTREDIIQQADFYNKLCALTVTAPTVTEEDFSSGALPFEDKEMIVEFATRQRDIDVVGHHIGGLEKVAEFRSFRGISAQYESLENL